MRVSTGLYLLGFALAVAVLAASIRGVATGGDGGEVAEIRFAFWGAAEEVGELRELVIEPINRRSERFRIVPISIPSDYQTKLATMIAGDAAPDIFYLQQESVRAFAAQGALLDLTDRIEAADRPVTDLSTYYAPVLELYRHDGRLFGLPWIAQPVILYCNVELFERAGVPLPPRPGEPGHESWDWKAFVETARRLTVDSDGDGQADQWGFVVTDGWPPPVMFVRQNGGHMVDPQTHRPTLDEPQVVEALDFLSGLIHRERIAPPMSVVSEKGFSDLFRAGRVAMFMGGAADDLDRLEGLRVVTREVPAGPGGRATFAYTAGLHVSEGTADADLAFEAYTALLDGIQHWKVPAPRRPLAARLEEIEPRKAPAAAVIRASMEYMQPPHIFQRQVEWDTLLSEEVYSRLLRAGTPARELIERARPLWEDFR